MRARLWQIDLPDLFDLSCGVLLFGGVVRSQHEIPTEDLSEVVELLAREESDVRDEIGHGSSGVAAATEADDAELVTGSVIENNREIGVFDFRRQTKSRSTCAPFKIYSSSSAHLE